MSSIDLHNEEISIKIVYYGPGLGGKTSSLQHMHKVLKPENRGRMISLATGIDRTLYFDFLPIQLPKIRNFAVRMSVYTVPGQVHYDATRKLVLQGADGVVFVADSQAARQEANIESMENLRENLANHGMNPESVPLVIQYNKRDIDDIMPVDQMEEDLNWRSVPAFETCALSGDGVFEALKEITKLVLKDLKKKGIYQDDRSRRSKPPEQMTDYERYKDPESVRIDISERTNGSSEGSDSLASAINHVTHLQQNDSTDVRHTIAPDAIDKSDEETGEFETHAADDGPTPANPALPMFSHLWAEGGAIDAFKQMEHDFSNGDFGIVAEVASDILLNHLKQCGCTHGNLSESILVIGSNNSHYTRFKSISSKPSFDDTSLEDALFCLFFITDMELRMQAAGLR